jgi:hypothetical protein
MQFNMKSSFRTICFFRLSVFCFVTKKLNMSLHNTCLCCYSANRWQDMWQVLHLCSASSSGSKCNISCTAQFEQSNLKQWIFDEDECTAWCLYPFHGFNRELFAAQYCTVCHFSEFWRSFSLSQKLQTSNYFKKWHGLVGPINRSV